MIIIYGKFIDLYKSFDNVMTSIKIAYPLTIYLIFLHRKLRFVKDYGMI